MKATGAQGALERAILDHVEAHPHAADSAQGVAQWWLGALGAAATPAEVVQALESLAARGRLRGVRLADGTTLYTKEAKPDATDTQH